MCRFDAGSPGHSSLSPTSPADQEEHEEGKEREGKGDDVAIPRDGKIAKPK